MKLTIILLFLILAGCSVSVPCHTLHGDSRVSNEEYADRCMRNESDGDQNDAGSAE